MDEPINIRTDEIYKGLFVQAVEKYPGIILFLGGEAVKYCNLFALRQFGISPEECEGKTLGELFKCANCAPKGMRCGGSDKCGECGKNSLFLSGLKDPVNRRDWKLSIIRDGKEEARMLRIWAEPAGGPGKDMVICYIQDVSDEKMREILENTFFHDILNEASILKGYTDNMNDGLLKCDAGSMGKVLNFAEGIIDTIQTQRDLLIAERGFYRPMARKFDVKEFFTEITEVMASSRSGAKRNIVFSCEGAGEPVINADKGLLKRIVINLVKNALEATDVKTIVKVEFRSENGKNVLSVNNPGAMPREIANQMFLKGFSTKGKGRGLGTYSAKFFTERFLNGEVSFRSDEGEGTTFFVKFPG
ncbi:MAG: HAMP domain-containing histidine kinase [Candidatus Omnitrophica bacterium]|nr:HAMP domain-containing histidine kinase [Candidatus Omnitrophota bacterium]